jgi:hypothetical protein
VGVSGAACVSDGAAAPPASAAETKAATSAVDAPLRCLRTLDFKNSFTVQDIFFLYQALHLLPLPRFALSLY